VKDRRGREIKIGDVVVCHEIKNYPNDGLTPDTYYGELGLVEEIEEDSSEVSVANAPKGAWFKGSELEVLQSTKVSSLKEIVWRPI
jgi:hypothetical protein